MIRVSEVKLGNSKSADEALSGALELLRQLYNAALEERIESWRTRRKFITGYDQQKSLTIIRQQDDAYAALSCHMTRLTVIRRLDFAFRNFFSRVKRGDKPGFPRFKGRDRFNTLVFEKGDGWRIEGKWLVVNSGSAWIRLRMKNSIHRRGEIRGLRLIKKLDRWWAHFVIDVDAPALVKQSIRGIGIDVGLKVFATLSNGEQIQHPKFLQTKVQKLAELQRRLESKTRRSNRYRKAKRDLALMHVKISNQRKDFIHQTAAALVRKFDGFAVEDLDVQGLLVKKQEGRRGLRRGIMDSGWRYFARTLGDKAAEAGLPFVRVNPKGTTQQCSRCGTLVRKRLGDRMHDCDACGLVLDRDINAALNIYDRGLRSAP